MLKSITQFLGYQRLFWQYAGRSLVALYVLIFVGGLVEAFGIVTLIPLLNETLGSNSNDALSRTISYIYNDLGVPQETGPLLLVIVVTFILRGFIVFAYTYWIARITADVRRDIQDGLTRRYGCMTYRYFASHSAGWLANIITVEVGRLVSSLRTTARLAVSAINAAIMLGLATTLQPELTLMVFALSALVLLLLKGRIGETATQSRQQTINAGKLNAELIQMVHAFIYLKATNATDTIRRRAAKAIEGLRENTLVIQWTSAFVGAIKEPIAVLVLAAFIYYEVVFKGGSMATAVVFALLIYRSMIQMVALAPVLQTFYQTVGGVIEVQKVEKELDIHSERVGGIKLDKLSKPIEFRDVSFRHGDVKILQDINLVVRPRETIGIVGASGAGKTTFFHLLTGLLEPHAGSITIAGIPSERIDKQSLRERIGYVTQEPVIFNDTIANNISLWDANGSGKNGSKRLREAARIAMCDEFIMAMPRKYHAALGDRGIRLSGGERQRVAIARELYKNPEILIFDEAASALDAESERYVQESIERMHGERTILVITHRLASVRHCDRVYVFQDGRIVENGTFSALYAKRKSYFRRLCDQQGVAS